MDFAGTDLPSSLLSHSGLAPAAESYITGEILPLTYSSIYIGSLYHLPFLLRQDSLSLTRPMDLTPHPTKSTEEFTPPTLLLLLPLWLVVTWLELTPLHPLRTTRTTGSYTVVSWTTGLLLLDCKSV